MGRPPEIVNIPEIIITADEKDEAGSAEAVSDTAKATAGAALDASARGVTAAKPEAAKLTPASSGVTESAGESSPAPQINEKMMRGQLSRESNDTLQKIANNPDVRRDPYAAAMARVALQIIQQRKGGGGSRPWYKFW